jgi:hypothetical protein
MIDISLEELLQALVQALDELLSEETIREALRAAIPTLGRINATQMGLVAKLPYSPRYIGKLKPSGKIRAGGAGDKGFGLDTEAFLSDLVNNWELDALELVNFSDRAYANRLADLAESKGTAVFAEDDAYLDVIEQKLGDRVEETWRDQTK